MRAGEGKRRKGRRYTATLLLSGGEGKKKKESRERGPGTAPKAFGGHGLRGDEEKGRKGIVSLLLKKAKKRGPSCFLPVYLAGKRKRKKREEKERGNSLHATGCPMERKDSAARVFESLPLFRRRSREKERKKGETARLT